MDILEEHKKLLSLITPISNAKFGNGYIDISYSKHKKETADSLGIKNEKIIDDLRLVLSADQVVVFKSIKDFKKLTILFPRYS